MRDDVNGFLGDFAEAWRETRLTRLLCYAIAAALVIAIAAAAVADLTRPRVYIIREGVARDAG